MTTVATITSAPDTIIIKTNNNNKPLLNTTTTNNTKTIVKNTDGIISVKDETDFESYRIALYYCYIPIPNIPDMMQFHKDLLLLSEPQTMSKNYVPMYGRIRIASEGINGVLSGLHVDLLEYENALRTKLEIISSDNDHATPFTWELDIKYCQLRSDLTVSSQLFTSLLIQKTSQVVGLVELENNNTNDNNDDNHGKKKHNNHKGYSGKRRQKRKEQLLHHHHPSVEMHKKAQELFQKVVEEIPQPLDDSAKTNGTHLSPSEWNEQIRNLVNNNNSKNNNNNNDNITEASSGNSKDKVIFLDCRNSYESAVGYFAAPNCSTVLTNTRKFSELPQVLLQESDRLKDASHIFMYCTGGVRCERASGFLQKMLEDKVNNSEGEEEEKKDTEQDSKDNSDSQDSQKEKKRIPTIYQLHGGIQRYLESDEKQLFCGKNFVFDPRRTDPLIGGGSSAVVGECLVCGTPHDDYDNGHAPIENKEARCYKCRILVLVCDTCRASVTCWSAKDDTAAIDSSSKPRVYCGGVGSEDKCFHMPPVREITNTAH